MLKSEVESRRVSSGHRCLVTLSQLVIVVLLSLAPSVAQVQEQSSKERKLITRVEPEYPETRKRLYIGGVGRGGGERRARPEGGGKGKKPARGNPDSWSAHHEGNQTVALRPCRIRRNPDRENRIRFPPLSGFYNPDQAVLLLQGRSPNQCDRLKCSSCPQCCNVRGRRSGGWFPYHKMPALNPSRTSMVASKIHRLEAAGAATRSTGTTPTAGAGPG